MKKSEFAQVKGLDVKELKNRIKNLRQEITNLVLDKNTNKLKDVKMISKKKKELAQVLTVIGQKELLGELESQIQKDLRNSENQRASKSVGQKVRKSDIPVHRISGTPSNSGDSEKTKGRVKKGAKK